MPCDAIAVVTMKLEPRIGEALLSDPRVLESLRAKLEMLVGEPASISYTNPGLYAVIRAGRFSVSVEPSGIQVQGGTSRTDPRARELAEELEPFANRLGSNAAVQQQIDRVRAQPNVTIENDYYDKANGNRRTVLLTLRV